MLLNEKEEEHGGENTEKRRRLKRPYQTSTAKDSQQMTKKLRQMLSSLEQKQVRYFSSNKIPERFKAVMA